MAEVQGAAGPGRELPQRLANPELCECARAAPQLAAVTKQPRAAASEVHSSEGDLLQRAEAPGCDNCLHSRTKTPQNKSQLPVNPWRDSSIRREGGVGAERGRCRARATKRRGAGLSPGAGSAAGPWRGPRPPAPPAAPGPGGARPSGCRGGGATERSGGDRRRSGVRSAGCGEGDAGCGMWDVGCGM